MTLKKIILFLGVCLIRIRNYRISSICRKQIQEVNWHRKNAQSTAGDKLHALETRLVLSNVYMQLNAMLKFVFDSVIVYFRCSWVGLVSKNYEIERTCAELENEMYSMKRMKQAEVMENDSQT